VSEGSRFVDPGLTRWAFLDLVLVVCPRCGSPAGVAPLALDGREPSPFDDRRATCSTCGLAIDWPGRRNDRAIRWWTDGRDPHLGLDLLLRTPCAGHTLWAYNEAHLDLVEQHVAAVQRKRPRLAGGGASLIERLPPWITAATNRDAVLKGCERLRALLPV
jgi:hypothetical protein